MDLRNLAKNGVFYSVHAKEKMQLENISERDVREAIENGEPKPDSSKTNYREYAWNKKQHFTFHYALANLTVVACESLEHGILICSVYHGLPHNLNSNPFNRRH